MRAPHSRCGNAMAMTVVVATVVFNTITFLFNKMDASNILRTHVADT